MNRRNIRGAQSKPFVSAGTIYQNTPEPVRSYSKPERIQNANTTPAKPISGVVERQAPPPPTPEKMFIEKTVPKPAVVVPTKPVESAPVSISVPLANDNDDVDQPGTKGFFKKMFRNRKKPSVRAKEKKVRQNRLIRRVLIPKNALMALHEVKNIKIDDFHITSCPGGGFQAVVTVNNVQYEGNGNSKNAAKSNVCEKALRDLVIAKMSTKPSRSNSTENLSNLPNDIEMKDLSAEGEEEEDEVPILNLASFALFKLFSEWESEGYEIPEFRPGQTNGNQSDGGISDKQEKPKKQPAVRSELPPDWESMHPATLLCMMRPGLTYIDLGAEGVAPNQIQKTGVTVDDKHFIGNGKSKKIARKNAAGKACNDLFNTNFPLFTN